MSIDTRVNQDSANTITEERTAPPAQITVSQIVEDLENGRDRKAIKAKYGLTVDELKMIFEHPKLKGMRVKKSKVIRFTLIDDSVDVNQTSIPVEQDEASVELVEALNPEFIQPTENNFYNSYNDNQTEIQD